MSGPFRCLSCGSPHGRTVLDLGSQPLANNLLRPADLGKTEPRFPLRVAVCEACWLLQITEVVPPVELFSEYPYFSSFSDSFVRHARAAAERYAREFALGPASSVVEIASNDGCLLRNFIRLGVPCLGIEPAANVADVARAHGVETIADFFGGKLAERIADEDGPADLILGNNVLAHAPDTNDFVAGLARLLRRGGRIVLEFPYAVDLVAQTEFDTIYHEHVFYFTLTSLQPLFARHALEIIHVEHLDIHGGSLRIFVGHPGDHARETSVGGFLAREAALGVGSIALYENFAAHVERVRHELLALLARLRAGGKSIAAYGASAKGSTLLNFLQPPAGTIEFIVDRSPHKQGALSPGLHLPILPPETLLARQPDFALLLTWNFAGEIFDQQAEYRARGGRFIVPIPQVTIR
ncbi:MAG: class I SAM-dependent methyltransferase [Chthoniobacteraceae bacterium]